MKKFLLLVWIIGWTFVGFQQVPITLQSLNVSNNQKNWPPDGYVIVENRSGEKIMITEETDEKFNPKNTEICSDDFISTIDASIENNTLFISYNDNPNFFGVNKIQLQITPSGDDFYPDRGFKIHNFKTIGLSNNSYHEIPLNIYERVDKNKYYIDFILKGYGTNNQDSEACFTELLLSINEDNFVDYKKNVPFYVNDTLEPVFEENPNIFNIGENEFIENYVYDNNRKLLNNTLPGVHEAAIVLLNKSTRHSELEDKDIWIYYPTYFPEVKKEIVIGLFGDVTRRDFLTVANVLETLKVVAPNLKITISDDGRDVTLPIHITPCDRLVSEKFNRCEGYAAGIYYGFHDYIWVDASITNKDWRSHVIIHELGHALGLNHNLCIDSVVSYSDFADTYTYFNYLDLMQLRLLYHPDSSDYEGKSFESWAVDYFNLDEELIKSYKDDPYLACNVVQDGWEKYIDMQQ